MDIAHDTQKYTLFTAVVFFRKEVNVINCENIKNSEFV